jgi:hypothetical protein
MVYAAQINQRECRKLLTNSQLQLYFLGEAIPGFIYIQFDQWVNNQSEYADGFSLSMLANRDGHITLPLIMYTCTAALHAQRECQKTNGVNPKASK